MFTSFSEKLDRANQKVFFLIIIIMIIAGGLSCTVISDKFVLGGLGKVKYNGLTPPPPPPPSPYTSMNMVNSYPYRSAGIPNKVYFYDRLLEGKTPYFINIQKHFVDGPMMGTVLVSRIYVEKCMLRSDVEKRFVPNKFMIDGIKYHLIHTKRSYAPDDAPTCHFEFSQAKEL